ncbi:MAG: peptide chain release factor N(5)-glutamine methyltransferase [Bacteroidota bacterium]
MLSAQSYFLSFAKKLTAIYDKSEANAITNYVTSELLMIKFNQLNIIDKNLDPADVGYFDAVLAKLLTHEPVQYVLGFTWFCGMKFEVNRQVLIPRPETEELVELLVAHCRQQHITHPKVLDLGTGSGCIPVAIKKNIPGANMYALDVMEQALETAKHNARINKVEVTFFKDDMLNPELLQQYAPFDLIISNPPYIAEEEAAQMEGHVTTYEPHVALFAPGDPLKFYTAIHQISKKHLKEGGTIWLEINPLLADETAAIFLADGTVEIIKDMSGKKRFVKAG